MPKTGENIYKRKDGRWEARFISGRKPDGCAKYTSVYARTYAAAKAKLEERKRMVVSRPAGSCRLTVKELFVWYLSQAEIKPSTRARYVFLIEHHISRFIVCNERAMNLLARNCEDEQVSKVAWRKRKTALHQQAMWPKGRHCGRKSREKVGNRARTRPASIVQVRRIAFLCLHEMLPVL